MQVKENFPELESAGVKVGAKEVRAAQRVRALSLLALLGIYSATYTDVGQLNIELV